MHSAGVQRHLSHASAGATPACLAGRLTSMPAGPEAVGHREQVRLLSDAPLEFLSFLFRCHGHGPGVITIEPGNVHGGTPAGSTKVPPVVSLQLLQLYCTSTVPS